MSNKHMSVEQLVAELKLFNHHEAAAMMLSLQQDISVLWATLKLAQDEADRQRNFSPGTSVPRTPRGIR